MRTSGKDVPDLGEEGSGAGHIGKGQMGMRKVKAHADCTPRKGTREEGSQSLRVGEVRPG
jgi:hypothetical protein